jgi:hypothetical protein
VPVEATCQAGGANPVILPVSARSDHDLLLYREKTYSQELR